MRKEVVLILAGAVAFSASPVFGQAYPVTSITISMPANPDANTKNWAALTITAVVAPRTDSAVANSRVLVTIRQGEKKVCGAYTSTSAPAVSFTEASKAWSGGNATSLLDAKGCTLSPGDYELTVQTFSTGKEATPSSRQFTKPFTIRGTEQQRMR